MVTSGPGPPPPGPLSALVAQLCGQLGGRVGPRSRAGLREVAGRLAAPPQVVVAGRLSSGKSTLVNALVGRRVAATGAGGCTRLVSRFRHGTADRVEVVCRAGRRRPVPFDAAGMVPSELGVDLAEVSHLEVYLTAGPLRDLTVVDTPGLGSPDATWDPDATRDASAEVVADAEAVVYVLTQTVRADDARMLAARTAPARWLGAVAVLNKIDTVPPESVPGSRGEVSQVGALLAAHQAEVLGPRVAEVLPMIGVLAETAETGVFGADEAEALAVLAGADPATRGALQLSADLFTGLPAPLPAATRRRLLELMDLHGVSRALAALQANPDLGIGALRRVLREASGLDRLQARLATVLRAAADPARAAAAVASITELARACVDPREGAVLRDAVEVLLARPEAHQLRLLEALGMVSSGGVALPPELVDEVRRVSAGGTAAERLGLPGRPRAELAAHALARAGWWRSFAGLGATSPQSRVSYAVHRAYFLLWQQLRGEAVS